MWKRYANYEGGTADPLIVSWPHGIAAAGGLRRQYCHAIDIVPTLYECLGVELPDVVNGYTQKPLEGVSFRSSFDDADAPTRKQTQFYSMLGTRAIWHQGWKAATAVPAAPDSWGDFHQQKWELFDTQADPSECHDLAEEHPEKLQELIALWWAEAGEYQALPLESRGAVEILATERPQLSKPRTRYVYYPGGAEVPESVAPNIRNRSYTIAAEMDIETPEASGVIFSQGSRFGGHALYVKDGRLKYVYNWIGELEQIVESAETIPSGHVVLSASFERQGDTMPAQGTLSSTSATRRSGRTRSGPSPASSDSAAAGWSSDAPAPSRSPTTTPATRPGRSSAARSSASSSTSAAKPFVDLATEARAAFARQ